MSLSSNQASNRARTTCTFKTNITLKLVASAIDLKTVRSGSALSEYIMLNYGVSRVPVERCTEKSQCTLYNKSTHTTTYGTRTASKQEYVLDS